MFVKSRFLATVLLFKDITKQKKMIDYLEHNQAQIIEKERLASLGQLTGGIAHNLKTPMMACAGGIDIIARNTQIIKELFGSLKMTKEKRFLLEQDVIAPMESWEARIKEYMTYMYELIHSPQGQIAPSMCNENSDFSLRELVNLIQNLMKVEVRKHKCSLGIDLDMDDRIRIRGNMNYMVQVLINLINNAMDAYEGKGGEVRIAFELTEKGNLEIRVSDQGMGIPKNLREELFTKMFTTKGSGGTGIGLFITRTILTGKFEGEIRFESEEGKGTTFFITVPASYILDDEEPEQE